MCIMLANENLWNLPMPESKNAFALSGRKMVRRLSKAPDGGEQSAALEP